MAQSDSISKKVLDSDPRKFGFFLAVIALIFIGIRLLFLNIPMERDEGEYATLGLGIIHGIPPYLEGYTMKLPGGAFCYALLFLLLGPTVKAIHLGLLIVNAFSIVLVGILGRRLIGGMGGLFAAAAFGTFTMGMGMFGPWLSAEHFATLFLLMGAVVILPDSSRWIRLRVGAFFLGASFVVKQHALFPATTWLMVMVCISMMEKISLKRRVMSVLGMCVFFVLPLISAGFLMKFYGVYDNFRFWTFEYAARYVSAVDPSLGWEFFKIGASKVFSDSASLWIFAGGGLALIFSSKRPRDLTLSTCFLLAGSAIAACFSAGMGLMFRGQYFILLAPFAALLAGVTWKVWSGLFTDDGGMRKLAQWAVLGLCFLPLVDLTLLGVQKKPAEISRMVYGMNPFAEYQAVADYIQKNTTPDEKIAVLGSEPALYFLTNRRPAYPYLCVYEMMKPHAFVHKMQVEAIHSLETARPRYMVVVNAPTSWGVKAGVDPLFHRWMRGYIPEHYVMEGIVDLIDEQKTIFKWGEEVKNYKPESLYTMIIYRRKD